MPKCDMCLQEKKNVSHEPSRSQLLFGGFNVRMESRCSECEKKVIKWVKEQLSATR